MFFLLGFRCFGFEVLFGISRADHCADASVEHKGSSSCCVLKEKRRKYQHRVYNTLMHFWRVTFNTISQDTFEESNLSIMSYNQQAKSGT